MRWPYAAKVGFLSAALLIATGLSLVIWGFISHLRPSAGEARRAVEISHVTGSSAVARPLQYPSPVPGAYRPVDIPVSLLCDYYEHGIEHAPPRDPSGVMQLRERHYAAPADPCFLLDNHSGGTDVDGRLARLVTQWRTDALRGHETTSDDCKALQAAAERSWFGPCTLIDIGRAFAWLDGDSLAASWFRAGLNVAQRESAGIAAGDPASRPLLHLLDQTKALWRLKDYPTLERRFRLAKALNPRLSPEERRASYLLAEMLYYQRRLDQAANAILELEAEHAEAGDLGAKERSDIPEMHWVTGLFLLHAGRFIQAKPHFEALCRSDSEHAEGSFSGLASACLGAGEISAACEILEEWRVRFGPDPSWQAAAIRVAQASSTHIEESRSTSVHEHEARQVPSVR